jgi:hypothetical protein
MFGIIHCKAALEPDVYHLAVRLKSHLQIGEDILAGPHKTKLGAKLIQHGGLVHTAGPLILARSCMLAFLV